MELTEVMEELEAMGTEQNRKVYPRHGARFPMFGVSFANLGALQKRIKTDHALAMALWQTGNHDARMLACRIADPAAVSVSDANEMAKACDNYVVAESFAGMLSDAPIAHGRGARWRDRKDEWIASAGWAITASLALKEQVSAGEGRALLDQIEAEISTRPNRVRHEMNQVVIALGLLPELHDRALEVAAAISPVDVDHGETSCQTPDAAAYIERTLAHRAKMAAKRAAKAAEKG